MRISLIGLRDRLHLWPTIVHGVLLIRLPRSGVGLLPRCCHFFNGGRSLRRKSLKRSEWKPSESHCVKKVNASNFQFTVILRQKQKQLKKETDKRQDETPISVDNMHCSTGFFKEHNDDIWLKTVATQIAWFTSRKSGVFKHPLNLALVLLTTL